MNSLHASILAALALVGCSESSETTSTPDTSNADVAVDAGPAPIFAFLTVENWSRGAPEEHHTIVAMVPFRIDGTQSSMTTIDAHCRCHEGDWSPKAPGFGKITMSGGSEGTVTFEEGYETPAAKHPGWKAGDVLTFKAAGADLPPFTLTSTVPPVVLLTNLDLPSKLSYELTMKRTEPFALRWAPTTGEVFALVLQFEAVDGGDVHILRGLQCFFPGSAGSGDIPVAALGRLKPVTGFGTNFYFGGVDRKTQKLTGVDLELSNWNGWSARITVD